MNVRQFLETSLADARKVVIDAPSTKARHRARSQAWVTALAANLPKMIPNMDSVKVFHRHEAAHRGYFGCNEFLYDILACRAMTVRSVQQKRDLGCFTEILWAVESEFGHSGAIMKDFNKLVVTSAAHRLFVGGQRRDPQALLGMLTPAAQACCRAESLHVGLVPHPKSWGGGLCRVEVWAYQGGNWQSM